MKKILSIMLLSVGLFSSEVQFGKGNFSINAKFLGLSGSKSEDITTYSLVNEHTNIFSTTFFYSYKLSYYKSRTLATTSNYLSSLGMNNSTIYNKLRGVDLNVVLGKDFINEDNKDTYLGVGLLVGASFPYLKTSSNSNNNSNNNFNYLKDSKTKFYTYKIGLSLKGQKAFNRFVNGYISSAYAFQKAKVKNNEARIDSSSNGNYFTFNTGLKFQLKTKKKIGFITLSPSVFATVGYRYDYWKVKDVDINAISLKTDITFRISQIYIGLGYNF